MENSKGKRESVEGDSSNGTWAGSFKKNGSVIPKKGKPVLHMAVEKFVKGAVSACQKNKDKNKVNPYGGSNA